jgi:hypothetical protein
MSSSTDFTLRLMYFSIVAVQGLWANPNFTWNKDGVMWLSDMLPKDIPGARIMTFEPPQFFFANNRKHKRSMQLSEVTV